MATERETPSPSSCPVDPSARAAWLEAAARNHNPPPIPHPLPPSTSPTSQLSPPPRILQQRPLASDRVISTIPRADLSPPTVSPNPNSPAAVGSPNAQDSPNAQTPNPSTSSSGNWIYPSERMFFDALSRKAHAPNAADMAAVVPIHNAVNERAWQLIKGWELGSDRTREMNKGCGGPRLRSFKGESGRLTVRARVYGWLGYERPFDRHDWLVERCAGGKRDGEGRREVEYVIDFYRGRGGAGNFFLDVRPKMNTWEGVRMRVVRLFGLG